jgi:hypothetical protein
MELLQLLIVVVFGMLTSYLLEKVQLVKIGTTLQIHFVTIDTLVE